MLSTGTAFATDTAWGARSYGIGCAGASNCVPAFGFFHGNGDGKADVGILRNGTFYLDGNGNRVWNNTSGGDLTYAYGLAGDIPLVGTWKMAIGSTAVPKSVGETPIVPDKGRGGIIESEPTIGLTTSDIDRWPASAMAAPAKKKTRLVVDELFASSEVLY